MVPYPRTIVCSAAAGHRQADATLLNQVEVQGFRGYRGQGPVLLAPSAAPGHAFQNQ